MTGLRRALVLFDLDGVLVDSRVAITRSINAALEALGLPPRPESELVHHIGPPLHGVFGALLPELGADPARVDEAVVAYRARYRAISLTETTLAPGVADLLAGLGGRRLAVVTSKPEAFAVPILEALGVGGCFERVVGPSLEARGEPKVETLARALGALEPLATATGPRAVMVGDRHHDVTAARTHGLPCIGVTWGIGDAAELREAGAERLVDSPGALLELLSA